jgi:hypothetical protein
MRAAPAITVHELTAFPSDGPQGFDRGFQGIVIAVRYVVVSHASGVDLLPERFQVMSLVDLFFELRLGVVEQADALLQRTTVAGAGIAEVLAVFARHVYLIGLAFIGVGIIKVGSDLLVFVELLTPLGNDGRGFVDRQMEEGAASSSLVEVEGILQLALTKQHPREREVTVELARLCVLLHGVTSSFFAFANGDGASASDWNSAANR